MCILQQTFPMELTVLRQLTFMIIYDFSIVQK